MNADKYAVYVTSGTEAYNSNIKWGGCHITMAGFSREHGKKAKLDVINEISKNSLINSSAWKPSAYNIQNWNGKWTVVIKSKTLDVVGKTLQIQGFEEVKGPKSCKTAFHITLPHVKSKQEAKQFAKGLSNKDWYLTVAKTEDSKLYEWVHYTPLGKL